MIASAKYIALKREPPAQSAKRMAWVDYAKGLAILLVVIRHCIVGLNRSGIVVPETLYNIQEFVFNFRMPVFFVLSGIFLSKSLKKVNTSILMSKKVKTLLYPYLLWTVIFITLQIFLSDYTNSDRTLKDYKYIITQPRELDHMWYLLALFNTSILYLVLNRFLHKSKTLHLIIAVVFHFLSFLLKDYSLFSDVFYHYIFLFVGATLSSRILMDAQNDNNIWKTLLLLTPFFIAGQLFWLNNPSVRIGMQPIFLLIIMVACAFFYFFCRFFYKHKIFNFLTVVGKNSLYVYILHFLVISSLRILFLKVFGLSNPYLIVSLSLIFGISIPIIFYTKGKKFGIHYLFSLEKTPVKK